MKGVLSGGRMVWVDKVPGGNQIGGIMCITPSKLVLCATEGRTDIEV